MSDEIKCAQIFICDNCGDHAATCGTGDLDWNYIDGVWEVSECQEVQCANCDYRAVQNDLVLVPQKEGVVEREPGFTVFERDRHSFIANSNIKASVDYRSDYIKRMKLNIKHVHTDPWELWTAVGYYTCMDAAATRQAELTQNNSKGVFVVAVRLPNNQFQFPEGTVHFDESLYV